MDIVLRATLAFFFVLFVTRIVGRRELSSLQPFDLILLVMIGDLVQQGVTQNDFSVTGLVLAGGTIAVLTVAVSYGNFKIPFLRPVIDGEPVIVVQDGEAIDRNLARTGSRQASSWRPRDRKASARSIGSSGPFSRRAVASASSRSRETGAAHATGRAPPTGMPASRALTTSSAASALGAWLVTAARKSSRSSA